MKCFQQGYTAFMEGQEFWANPYSEIDCNRNDFAAWFAGWCRAKKDLK